MLRFLHARFSYQKKEAFYAFVVFFCNPSNVHWQQPCFVQHSVKRFQNWMFAAVTQIQVRECQSNECDARRPCPALHIVDREWLQVHCSRTSNMEATKLWNTNVNVNVVSANGNHQCQCHWMQIKTEIYHFSHLRWSWCRKMCETVFEHLLCSPGPKWCHKG